MLIETMQVLQTLALDPSGYLLATLGLGKPRTSILMASGNCCRKHVSISAASRSLQDPQLSPIHERLRYDLVVDSVHFLLDIDYCGHMGHARDVVAASLILSWTPLQSALRPQYMHLGYPPIHTTCDPVSAKLCTTCETGTFSLSGRACRLSSLVGAGATEALSAIQRLCIRSWILGRRRSTLGCCGAEDPHVLKF